MTVRPDLADLARPVRAEVRKRIEDAIERLIETLDEIDGDADLEPYLGWTQHSPWFPSQCAGTDDREDEDEREDDEREEDHRDRF